MPIQTAKDAIGWWEARRIPFNLIVGSAGIVSSALASLVVLGSYFLGIGNFAISPPVLVFFGIILYAVAANVCFTGGWLAELAVRKFWPNQADMFATSSFSVGLIFSVLLTLTPGFLFGTVGIVDLLAHFLRTGHQPM